MDTILQTRGILNSTKPKKLENGLTVTLDKNSGAPLKTRMIVGNEEDRQRREPEAREAAAARAREEAAQRAREEAARAAAIARQQQNQGGGGRDRDPAPSRSTPTNVGNPFGYR